MPIRLIQSKPVAPDQGNIIHWYDFNDIDTLFQDTAGLTPVTVATDPIARCNDKGSRADNALQNTATQEPLWDGLGAVIDAQIFDRFDATAEAEGALNGNFTFAACWEFNSSGQTEYSFTWDPLNTWIQKSGADVLNIRVMNTSMTNSAGPGDGTIIGAWCFDDGADAQLSRGSWVGGTTAATATSSGNGPRAADSLGVGGFDGASNALRDSSLREIIVWNGALSADDRTTLEAYFADKHGVSWT